MSHLQTLTVFHELEQAQPGSAFYKLFRLQTFFEKNRSVYKYCEFALEKDELKVYKLFIYTENEEKFQEDFANYVFSAFENFQLLAFLYRHQLGLSGYKDFDWRRVSLEDFELKTLIDSFGTLPMDLRGTISTSFCVLILDLKGGINDLK